MVKNEPAPVGIKNKQQRALRVPSNGEKAEDELSPAGAEKMRK